MNYAFFLLEMMKNRNKALEELEICEKGKTNFDEEFLIFRYKCYITKKQKVSYLKFLKGKSLTKILML